MRRSIVGFVMAAIVVAAAQPAVAIDDGFHGLYRVTMTGCGNFDRTHPVRVR